MKIGYFLSSEEYTPAELIEQARLAEEAGFDGLWISDHFHPWNDEQGQSAVRLVDDRGDLPGLRAAGDDRGHLPDRADPPGDHRAGRRDQRRPAERAVPARHRHRRGAQRALLGTVWPTVDVRLEMLEEAVEIMRRLWTEDGFVTHHGKHYTVDTARIYTRPDPPLPIYMSGFGPEATDVAARIADGYITTVAGSPNCCSGSGTTAVATSRRRPGSRSATRRPKKKASSRRTGSGATPACPGELAQVLPSPRHFEQASELVTKESTAQSVAVRAEGRRPRRRVHAVRRRRLRRDLRRQHGPPTSTTMLEQLARTKSLIEQETAPPHRRTRGVSREISLR